MKTVRITRPMVYIDTNVWTIVEHPDTQELYLARVPVAANLISAFDGNDKLKQAIESLLGPVVIDDLGDWDNIASADGIVTHPFTKEKVDRKTLEIKELTVA